MAFSPSRLSSIGAASGALAVMIGAFGAHGLKGLLRAGDISQRQFEAFGTGANYHLLHSVLLVVIGLLPARNLRRASAIAVIIGIVLFSGSLYIYGVTGAVTAARITPVGGLSYILGWSLLALMLWKKPAS